MIAKEGLPTSLSRSALGFSRRYSRRSPPDTQFEMSWVGLIVTPRGRKTFGWSKCFHHRLSAGVLSIISDRQDGKRGCRKTKLTLVIVCKVTWEFARICLMQTFEPLTVPLYTSPKSPEMNGVESIPKPQVGSVALEPHILPSSRRNLCEAGLEGSR